MNVIKFWALNSGGAPLGGTGAGEEPDTKGQEPGRREESPRGAARAAAQQLPIASCLAAEVHVHPVQPSKRQRSCAQFSVGA